MSARNTIIWKHLTFKLNSINFKQRRGLPYLTDLLHALSNAEIKKKKKNDASNQITHGEGASEIKVVKGIHTLLASKRQKFTKPDCHVNHIVANKSLLISTGYQAITSYKCFICILYFPGLIRLQEVLKLAQGANHKVTVRKLAQHTSGYITMFKDLKAKNEYQIVIDCHSSKVKSVLHEVCVMGY